MTKPRKIETNVGIQGTFTVELYDTFARNMRDKGWNNVETFRSSGIVDGSVLEIGPGPGYVGLEWLKKSGNGTLTALDISPDMIRLARKNAEEYGLGARVTYVEGSALKMPFREASFDAAFSNGSLHEWEDPLLVFAEMERVLKPGGIFCVADMRRDVNPVLAYLIGNSTKPREIIAGFWSSLRAAYTKEELEGILRQTAFADVTVKKEFFGLSVSGRKRA